MRFLETKTPLGFFVPVGFTSTFNHRCPFLGHLDGACFCVPPQGACSGFEFQGHEYGELGSYQLVFSKLLKAWTRVPTFSLVPSDFVKHCQAKTNEGHQERPEVEDPEARGLRDPEVCEAPLLRQGLGGLHRRKRRKRLLAFALFRGLTWTQSRSLGGGHDGLDFSWAFPPLKNSSWIEDARAAAPGSGSRSLTGE